MTLRAFACQNVRVAPATQLQKRAVAIATALTLLAVGLLARWHEADAAHAREHSGRVVHAQALAEHHEESAAAHLHGREVHAHAGDCTLLAMAHEKIAVTSPHVIATPVEAITPVVAGELVTAHATLAAYRLAPKTSPPSA